MELPCVLMVTIFQLPWTMWMTSWSRSRRFGLPPGYEHRQGPENQHSHTCASRAPFVDLIVFSAKGVVAAGFFCASHLVESAISQVEALRASLNEILPP